MQNVETTKKITETTKAYENSEFLNSVYARPIRILCEFQETYYRLKSKNVKNTILFFGSSRARSNEVWEKQYNTYKNLVKDNPKNKDYVFKLNVIEKSKWLCIYYDMVYKLSKKLSLWSKNRYYGKYKICTGGGPGMMEAANKGASDVGLENIGMGITLPFEKGLNQYVSKHLAFEYNYFFTRKFWMSYPCKALVVAPGGLGTLDELFEILTLIQTGKTLDKPIVCLGKEYWNDIINWKALSKYSTVSERDLDMIFFTDDVNDAFEYIIKNI